jgi:RNA polymerase sigma-70 factor (ECF subfamily)
VKSPQSDGAKRPPDRTSALDDTELLAALRRGDAAAATALYLRARPHVDRTILTLLARRDVDHEDLVQLAMIALVGSLGRFRGECSLDTWISRVAARTLFKELRRRRGNGKMMATLTEIEAVRSHREPDPELVAGQRDVMNRVQRHLDEMDPQKAWTVVLHDVCGCDLREIAEITEVTVAAAQSRLVRGRAELHERLGRDSELASALEKGSFER